MTYDSINPFHYRGNRKYEPIDVIEDWGLNYHLGNALKYISRSGRKPGEDPQEGLTKAIWYLERLKDKLSEESKKDSNYPMISYEEFLADVAASSAEGEDFVDEYGNEETAQSDFVKLWGTGDDSSWDSRKDPMWEWNSDDDILWDPTTGPVEVSQEEIQEILSSKNLKTYDKDEIVSIVERRGLLMGFKKDGSSCLLNSQGRCD